LAELLLIIVDIRLVMIQS